MEFMEDLEPGYIEPTSQPVKRIRSSEKGSPVEESLTSLDTGLGTTYERWSLYRWFARFQSERGVRTVFEGPDDGMTGIAGLNSLALGLAGAHVSLFLPSGSESVGEQPRARFAKQVWAHHAPEANFVVIDQWDIHHLPASAGEYDLVWNFNVMTRYEDLGFTTPQELLAELVRISRKYVLIFVPNRMNYSFWLHRLHHRVAGQHWNHGRVELMQPGPWQQMFAELDLHVQEIVWVDCPWWPDIVDVSELIGDFFPPLKRRISRARPEQRYRWTAEELPYFRPQAYPDVHQHMQRLAFFENSSNEWLKKRFAHHVGILGVKGQGR